MVQLPGDDAYLAPFIDSVGFYVAEAHTKHPDRGPHLYRRDIVPVFPIPDKRRFKPMTPEYFCSWVERFIAPYKVRHDKEGDPHDVARPVPKEAAKACLDSYDFAMKLPEIQRAYPAPVPLIPEDGGRLRLAIPGYDAETGSYVYPSDFKEDPSLLVKDDSMATGGGYYDDSMTLGQAVRYLHKLLCQFPFSDWSEPFTPAEDSPFYDPEKPEEKIRLSRSLAVQIMAMLSVFAKGCVPQKASRLGFLMNANLQRSGKTLLVKMIVAAIHGYFKAQAWREKDEDMLKILDAETLAAADYICFDNVRGVVASQPLEGFMTTPVWTGRILGRSEMFDGENNAIVFLTGNNTSLGPDMKERLLIVDLYVETADRQNRDVEIAPEDEIDDVWLSSATNRRQILSALWAIVRHWDAAGRPSATGKPRKGFGTWCRILAGMVEFAGFGDALEMPKNLDGCGEHEEEDIRTLLPAVLGDARAKELTFQEVVHRSWQEGLFPWLMHGSEEFHADLGMVTLKLSDKYNAKFGLVLQRNCSGERGIIYTFKSPDFKSTRRIRLSCKGKGRSRRFHFDDVTNPS